MKGRLEFMKDLINIVMFCWGDEPCTQLPYAVIKATGVRGHERASLSLWFLPGADDLSF
jgi:hypothetical protein